MYFFLNALYPCTIRKPVIISGMYWAVLPVPRLFWHRGLSWPLAGHVTGVSISTLRSPVVPVPGMSLLLPPAAVSHLPRDRWKPNRSLAGSSAAALVWNQMVSSPRSDRTTGLRNHGENHSGDKLWSIGYTGRNKATIPVDLPSADEVRHIWNGSYKIISVF